MDGPLVYLLSTNGDVYKRQVKTILVAMRLGETPVHIPNTMVKTQTADDTILELSLIHI